MPKENCKRRIAMWSPPRARSTMMMRVFEALGCAVFDEPFYPYWLKTLNKVNDPGFKAAINNHDTDWRSIIDLVLGPIPEDRVWYYQKHMAIHMLDEVDLTWMNQVRNCFLIRNPAEVIVSMAEFRNLKPGESQGVEEAARLVGIPQLRRIFDLACETCGGIPPIIDANDVLDNPTRVLGGFCDAIGMDFIPDKPIRWEPGRHKYDGAWADAWYGKVYKTTCLEPYKPKQLTVAPELQAVVDYCMPVYEHIAQFRIT